MVIKKLFVLILTCIGITACSFQERSFKDLACVSDQDCSRPDQECRSNICTQRECTATMSCPTGHEFSCTAGLCVVAECTNAAGCSNGYACSEGFCQASFNVTRVLSVSNTTIAVTFDSPPDATTAADATNYSVNGLALTGTATLNGSTVTLGTSSQTAASYKLTVSDVIRDFDQAPLIIASGTFNGRGPFALVDATSTSAVSVALTFSEPPDPTSAVNFGNYVINNGLAVSNSPLPTIAGNVVTLTTGSQGAGTYTVTVSNVARASDGEALSTNMATFAGRTNFNVASIETKSSTQIAVTFDAPPNVVQAAMLANYSVPGLTLSGTPTVVGSVVTITTSAQLAQTYTLTVTGVARASDAEPLTVNSKDFVGRPPFNVVDALARTTQSISVTFDDAPNPSDAVVLSNYSVGGLVLSGTPSLAGNVVFLMTSTQSASTYTATVTNVRRASDLEPLTVNTAMFNGRPPFDVTTTSATSSTSIAVSFSAPPNSGQAILAGNYTLSGGVTVLGVSALSGNTVTLTTTPMAATTYTVTVAGVTRATDGEQLLVTSAMFTGRAPFDVASAAAPTSSTITVTFSAAPSSAATTLANYSVPGLTLTGTPVVLVNTVTITTTAQLAQTYTVTVTGVTRQADGEPLATSAASFTGRSRFNVASASSGSNVIVRVTFDAPPKLAQATTLANYNVPGLALSGTPTVYGNTVTIMTANQTGGATYTVTVSGVTRQSDSEPLTTNSASFTGLTGFNVVGAVSANTTTVTVTFDAPPSTGPAQTAANYLIAGLSVMTASYPGTGNTVTLTTSAQASGTYTVSVAGAVTRASDNSPLVVNTAQFTYTSFNVMGAAALTNRSASVTFDAAPNAAQAAVQSNYTVVCSPSACTNIILSAPTLVGNVVTLTTTAQQAGKAYTITVNNVTRASDGSSLSAKTGNFIGRSSFNVTSASAPTSGTLAVTFDGGPVPVEATTLANYSVSGLTLSGSPVLVGNVVTINTSVQSAQSYVVSVSNVTRATDGEPLFVTMASFTGKAQTSPTVTNVVVQSTVPDNGTTFYNTGTATVVITGTEFNGVDCLTGVKLDDVDGAGALVNTKPVTCTVSSATTITATFPEGISSKYAGWNVQVTNSVATNATSGAKLVVKAGLLVSEIYVGSGGGGNDVKEYVEVYNPTANTLNFDTLGLNVHTRDNAGGDGTLGLTFSGSVCGGSTCNKDIPSHKFWLLVSSVSSADTWYSHRDGVYSAATRQLVTNGGVYLSLSATAQAKVIDKAGWGNQPAAGREGTAIAAFGNDNKSAQRKPGTTTADTDTDANSSDFNAPVNTLSPKGTRD